MFGSVHKFKKKSSSVKSLRITNWIFYANLSFSLCTWYPWIQGCIVVIATEIALFMRRIPNVLLLTDPRAVGGLHRPAESQCSGWLCHLLWVRHERHPEAAQLWWVLWRERFVTMFPGSPSSLAHTVHKSMGKKLGGSLGRIYKKQASCCCEFNVNAI